MIPMCSDVHGAELLVLGTGARIVLPSSEVRQMLLQNGIGLEVADTVCILNFKQFRANL